MHIGTYERLGVTVFASHREVIRAASRKLKPGARLRWLHRLAAIGGRPALPFLAIRFFKIR